MSFWRLSFFLLLISTGICAQDSLRYYNPSISTYTIPGALLISGLALNDLDTKTSVRDWVRDRIDISTTRIDDYLQHLPIAMMYLSDFRGTSKPEVMRQTRHLLVTQGLTLGSVYILKAITQTKRPNGGSRAFPSGHTAYAFAGATVLFHSLKEEHPFWAYSGYAPAIVTGAFRIIRDKHWVSDVVFGAGLGLLFGHLTYHVNLWDSASHRLSKQQDSVELHIGSIGNGVGLVLEF